MTKVHATLILCILLESGRGFGQLPSSISQKTTGQCSPAVVSEGQVSITCTGLDERQKETLQRLPALMDQLLKSNQFGLDQLLAKLDELLRFQKDAETRSAASIASSVVEKTSVYSSFVRELEKPVEGIYAVLTLSKPLTEDHLTNIAAVVSIQNGIDEKQPGLFLGIRPDFAVWTEFPGNKKVVFNGIRSEVWSYPRISVPGTKAESLASLLTYRFDFLDRLEAGAITATPFKTVGQMDRASVMFQASRNVIDYFDKLSLVVNDYVVLEIKAADIIDWRQPLPPLIGVMATGDFDPSSGMRNQKIIQQTPIDPNFMMREGFKSFPFFTALFSQERSQDPPPMNFHTALKLSSGPIRMHHIISGPFPSRAGKGEMMILPGEHGWLPKEGK